MMLVFIYRENTHVQKKEKKNKTCESKLDKLAKKNAKQLANSVLSAESQKI